MPGIGTGAAIAIAAISGGATVASNIYSTRRAGEEQKRATEAQRASEEQALNEEAARRETEERRLAAEREQRRWEFEQIQAERQRMQELDMARWRDYIGVMQPFWSTGAGTFGTITDLLGVPGGGMGGAPPPMTAPISMGGGGRFPMDERLPGYQTGGGVAPGRTMAVPGARNIVKPYGRPAMPTPQRAGMSPVPGMSIQDLAMLMTKYGTQTPQGMMGTG